MVNFDFLEKGFGNRFFANDFSRNMFLMLLTDQISLSDCLDLLRYWAIYALQLFASQNVTL